MSTEVEGEDVSMAVDCVAKFVDTAVEGVDEVLSTVAEVAAKVRRKTELCMPYCCDGVSMRNLGCDAQGMRKSGMHVSPLP